MLRLRAAAVICPGTERRFLVKAGPGGFVCCLSAAPDVSLGGESILTAFADTWLADEMLRGDQVLLCDDGLPGERLGDSWFVPPPLRAVSPGHIRTPMHAAETYEALAAMEPIGHVGEIDDIVGAILYLEGASFVTGEILHVDGGQSAGH